MGSQRKRELEAQIKNLQEIETTKGYDFFLTKQRILNQGRSDYKMKQAINYRNNYIQEMKKYRNYENYELLEKKMNSLTNPLSFFEFMSANELTQDLTYQSDEVLSQEQFNMFLNDLGIETEDELIDYDQEKQRILNELEVAEYNENKNKFKGRG